MALFTISATEYGSNILEVKNKDILWKLNKNFLKSSKSRKLSKIFKINLKNKKFWDKIKEKL